MKQNRGDILNNVSTLLKVMSRKFDDLEKQIKTYNFNFGGNKTHNVRASILYGKSKLYKMFSSNITDIICNYKFEIKY